MHVSEREGVILGLIARSGFISFRNLEERLDASPATIRRDLERLASLGRIARIRGGARLIDDDGETAAAVPASFRGRRTPF